MNSYEAAASCLIAAALGWLICYLTDNPPKMSPFTIVVLCLLCAFIGWVAGYVSRD
jgi:F0F1-type ATP synthase assembly protein I